MSRLENGQPFPSLVLPAVGGGKLSLPDDVAGRWATVLIYRGSWCPYCAAQLQAFSRAAPQLAKEDVAVVALSVDDDRLVMRGMVGTVEVPLAAIEQVAVRQVLAVRAGEKRYVSPVVSKSRRRLTRAERVRGAERPVQGEVSYADFVEERILHLAEQARSERGVALLSDEQLALGRDVRRAWAWPVVAAVTVPLVLFVLSVLL